MNKYKMEETFNKRIDRVEKIVKEADDSDRVNINIYDLIAYSLVSNQPENKVGNDYYSIMSTILEIHNENDQVSFHGDLFKAIINYMETKSLPIELNEMLTDIYLLHNRKEELKNIISNNQYDKKDKRIIFEKYNYLDNAIKDTIDRINYLDDETDYLESDFEPPFVCCVISGGHTNLIYVKNYDDFETLLDFHLQIKSFDKLL